MDKRTSICRWTALIMGGPLVLYWLSFGPLLRWEHSARTQKEFQSRFYLRMRLYAPLDWLDQIDPSGTFAYLRHINAKTWIGKTEFSSGLLPPG